MSDQHNGGMTVAVDDELLRPRDDDQPDLFAKLAEAPPRQPPPEESKEEKPAQQTAPPAPDPAEEWRKRIEAQQRALEVERQRRLEAERIAQQQYQAARSATEQAAVTNYDLIVNAMSAAEQRIEALKKEAQQAGEQGDIKRQVDLMEQVADARHNFNELRTGKEAMEARARDERARQEYAAANPPPQQPVSVEEQFEAAISNMSGPTQQWLRAHPDAITNPQRRDLVFAAHTLAINHGIQPDTPAYFDYIERAAHYKQAQQQPAQAQTQQRQTPANGRQTYAAPVNRPTSSNGGGGSRQVQLTAAELQFVRDQASAMGEDEKQAITRYAARKQQLAERRN